MPEIEDQLRAYADHVEEHFDEISADRPARSGRFPFIALGAAAIVAVGRVLLQTPVAGSTARARSTATNVSDRRVAPEVVEIAGAEAIPGPVTYSGSGPIPGDEHCLNST
jgi:hypothetical protein